MPHQQPVDPEALEAGFLDADDPNCSTAMLRRFGPHACE
jgi:hypothetical protein